jgi:hypothetical protein
VSLGSIRTLYCNVGIAAVGSFQGSSGGLLFGAWQYVSIETFNIALFLISGARVNIATLDCENPTGTTPLHIKDTAGTSLGYVGLCGNFTGTFTTPQVSATAKLDWRWLNANPGAVTAPAMPATAPATYLNQLGRAAAVVIAGGTISDVKVDGVSTGIVASPATVVVPNQKTIAITYSAAPTWVWTLL